MPNTVKDFAVGDRVKSHPGTDRFMMGDVYGTVKRIGRKIVHVHMDRSGKTVRFSPNNLIFESRENPRRRKHKKGCRCIICRPKKGRAKRHVRRIRTKRTRRGSRIQSRALPIAATRVVRPGRRRRVRALRKNPAHEFVVEAYKPKGHKFYYLQDDEMLTTDRNQAARYREKIHAMAKAKYVRDRVPRGIEWVRVCPA